MSDLSTDSPQPVVAETGTIFVKCTGLLGLTSSGRQCRDSKRRIGKSKQPRKLSPWRVVIKKTP